ncbi:glycosyltransferase [Paeniglutamicibacter sp. ZC-3]|uniref:glycosyltransferase family 2 protein n=1 Tax=Paeniglutamicibacter sp. ZC-3 TaxID=2986919 RepID=UPI0021F74D8A|nr:glycosyltransferase family 2 protein [Paeniglutamicibacter sp. ZC-3]MCV9992911.1 glycosyltransferase [Paeniglutamicibacter sp. ZC-3]
MKRLVSVVICAFTESRWNDLVRARASLACQSMEPAEVIIVIDYNPRLLERAREQFSDAVVVANTEAKGLSGARNSGVARASGEIVLFLDDDAVADTQWVRYMTEPFIHSDVVGVGGMALPKWDAGQPPSWFPEEFLWVVGCSYVGLPADGDYIRNPIGSSMGFRRASIVDSGGFSSGLGRIGAKPVGGEETELSMRMRQHSANHRVVLCRKAVVNHRVTLERHRLAYFMRRCYWEGVSKSVIVRRQSARINEHAESLHTEKSYVLTVLPAGVSQGIGAALRNRSLRPLGMSLAIVGGLLATCVGYARGSLVPEPVRNVA